ncbi:right-handed parallel beta-helix repeat-containing protein [Pelagicoccus mobilis]|uniref:Right-handed parallel beta-helix repeat-containing protein n=1 Tax=Pelagicoccus mobilis TaxID=415221 RepID=A0A934RTD0_9BACT|nr:right-handed parallel beta-helix repeat-containing protein [Pelagicoccus mobilis]MBK1877225.1 right-handed parallel beta-helix repeat-containing protein [Pelagicoccus mobilis]
MKLKRILLILSVLSHGVLQAETLFYVSTSGDDQNPGTKEQPFASLAQAQKAVAEVVEKSEENITVWIDDGHYALRDTLRFGAEDGGRKNQHISYRGMEGTHPVISGGMSLNGWVEHEKGIWKTPANGLNFRQVYIGGNATTRARHPNSGEYLRITLWNINEKEIFVPCRSTDPLKSIGDLEMIIQMNWTEQVARVKSFEATSDEDTWKKKCYSKIKLKEPERRILFDRDYPPKHPDQPYHFENAYVFLDQPGEWFLDTVADLLYYKPFPGQNMSEAEVFVPVLESLIEVKGTPDEKVKNLTFEGLTFKHSNWLRPSKTGYMPTQACQYSIDPTVGNEQYIGRPAAAVKVNYAKNITFHENKFTHLGNAAALDFHEGVVDSSIVGNVFHDISGTSMLIAKFSDPDFEIHQPYQPEDVRVITQDIRIANNYVYQIGTQYPGSNGITVGFGRRVSIEHNEISHTPYSGISVGWGWTHHRSVMEENIIRYNDIHHITQKLSDAGGIYTLSRQPGTRIYRNYIHHSRPSRWAAEAPFTGIYLDEASGGDMDKPMVVEENIVTAGGHSRYHMNVSGIALFKDNLNSPQARADYPLGNDGPLNELILEKVGLEPDYKWLKTWVSE